MNAKRTLIVNADDFGQSCGINRGIIEAHERGIVTSASLMVRWPAAAEAAGYARQHPALGIGLHFDLYEMALRDGQWTRLYLVAPPRDEEAVARELDQQIETFRHLLGADPDHIDSHQHAHRYHPVREIVTERAAKLGMPVREVTPQVQYVGAFYGQTGHGDPLPENISVEALLRILETLPEGITELGCHPDLNEDVDSMYVSERSIEVGTLCDPRIREYLVRNRIDLRSFIAALAECSL